MNDYYNCVRRFVVSDPELPDSLYMYSLGLPDILLCLLNAIKIMRKVLCSEEQCKC